MIKYREMLFVDCKPIVVTSETINNIKEYPERYVRCSPRIYMGKIYTNDEVTQYIQNSLLRPLPSNNHVQKVKRRFFN